MKSMSIDPGITGSGYAIWSGNKKLKNCGVIGCPYEDWQAAGKAIVAQLYEIMCDEEVLDVYCEMPAFYQSAGGMVTARSGSLVKLCWFVGFLNCALEKSDVFFHFVEVRDWKGQLPKEVVNKRIEKILGKLITKKFKTHAWDAVGIGLYIHGRMK